MPNFVAGVMAHMARLIAEIILSHSFPSPACHGSGSCARSAAISELINTVRTGMRKYIYSRLTSWVTCAVIVGLVLGNLQGPGRAAAVGLDHEQQARRLVQRSLDLQADIIAVQKGLSANSQTFECLSNISHDLDLLSTQFQGISTLVSILRRMVHASDESTVSGELKLELDTFVKQIDLGRRKISLTLGHCSRDAVVVAKGQEVLELYRSLGSFARSTARML
jgi:hypothetical protein